MGKQTLLHCLFSLLCAQSSLPWAHFWRSDTLGGWLLARQAVGAGLSAQDKARRKKRLSPALGDKPLAFPQLPWRAARLYHPCCGSQALSVGSENPCFILREKCCPHTQLESNCLHPACSCFEDHTFTPNGHGSGEGGPGRLYEAFLYKRRRGSWSEHRTGN